jgi:ATP-dependent helicase/nuclease subunit A
MAENKPLDQEQRDRIRQDMDSTFFVEAGAGTGKTSELVERICNLVASGKAEIGRIAAITFTEAAAAELKDRVREELEKRSAAPEGNPVNRDNCRRALESFDEASIQTLHSFAGSLLREKPFEAGLPPNFDVAAEMEAGIRFAENWQAWLDKLMESKDLAPVLLKAMQLGLKTENLKEAAKELHGNYDRLPEHFCAITTDDYITCLSANFRTLCRLQALVRPGCNDKLVTHLHSVITLLQGIMAQNPDAPTAMRSVCDFGKLTCSSGQKSNWDDDPESGLQGHKAVQAILKDIDERTKLEEKAQRSACLVALLKDLAGSIRQWVNQRLEQGVLEFHDLLVVARDLLKYNPAVREYFQHKFSHILIDEFQDTDPIQAEIAFFLAADPVLMGHQAATETDWRKISIAPGKLFVVGDPKQSIYRFRRADIGAVQQVSALLGGEPLRLEQNFRSQAPVIDWVNSIFREWIGEGNPGVQACYVNLFDWHKDNLLEPRMGVYRFGGQIEGKAYQVKLAEASALAGIIGNINRQGWKVRDKDSGILRPVKYSDICVLLITRTNLSYIERALDDAEIPYRLESESFVFGSQDVGELLSCLKAIDSPADGVALVAALRSSAFAISDVELVEFLDGGGNLDYTSPGNGGGRVAEALRVLADYNRRRMFEAPASLIESFVRERRMAELAFGKPRPRERLRRMKLVTEQARAFGIIGERSLRLFIEWMQQQMDEQARLVEIPVPETDEDAVRIMTIHAAKGLEFPVVLLAGLGSCKSFGQKVIFDDKQGTQVKLGPRDRLFCTAGYEEAEVREKTADEAEKIRLMYVAATRARDYLLVSLYRGKTGNTFAINERIEEISGQTDCGWRTVDDTCLERIPVSSQTSQKQGAADTFADRLTWIARNRQVIEAASVPQAVAVTTLAKQPEQETEEDAAYFRKGRGSTNLGRAVHSVLQTIDLTTGENLEFLSRAQADAEGIPERAGEVSRLVSKALEMPVAKRAVKSGRYWRELFISLNWHGKLVEGFIDLIFEEGGQLVIADYKTDVVSDFDDPARLAQYRLQAGLYALAAGELTGKPVREVALLFLSANREIVMTDIDSLIDLASQHI